MEHKLPVMLPVLKHPQNCWHKFTMESNSPDQQTASPLLNRVNYKGILWSDNMQMLFEYNLNTSISRKYSSNNIGLMRNRNLNNIGILAH